MKQVYKRELDVCYPSEKLVQDFIKYLNTEEISFTTTNGSYPITGEIRTGKDLELLLSFSVSFPTTGLLANTRRMDTEVYFHKDSREAEFRAISLQQTLVGYNPRTNLGRGDKE